MEKFNLPNNSEKKPGMTRGSFLKKLGILAVGTAVLGSEAFAQTKSKDLANSLESKESLNQFIKDAEDVYVRALRRYHEQSHGRFESFVKKDPEHFNQRFVEQSEQRFNADHQEFRKLLDEVGTTLALIKSGSLIISSEQFKNIKQDQLLIESEKSDRVAVLDAITENILKTFNPKSAEGLPVSEVLLVIPLTKGWFEKTPWLKEYYTKAWEDERLISDGASGEVVGKNDERFSAVAEQLVYLKSRSKDLPESPEKNWLMSLDTATLSTKEAAVFIHSESFNYDLATISANSIAVNEKFGPVSIHPLQTILLHEINMALGILPDDTHVHNADDFKQAESYLGVVNIAYILRRVKELQSANSLVVEG